MDVIYPAGPADVPPAYARPGASYRRQAWIAVASLLLFIVLYLALTAWFVMTGISELAKVDSGGLLQALMGAASLFFAAFLVKALFFVKKGAYSGGIELTRANQPRLFAFLERIADEAGAPRPHKVFVTPRVNAAVFYDLSLLNLLFPSRKNLEIGLALVNMLNLGELKAVLAHEFGHFAQRSMAVGRWVYTTQQIAAHIVGRRDALDGFLRGLSRLDIRIAWIGWLLSIVVWALRAVVDAVFRLVVVAQRALSREMEMQADLVAVSLTGSDALISALHRLQMADDAWDRSLNFLRGEVGGKHPPADIFAVHHAIAERLCRIYNDPGYGERPRVPTEGAASFRVFAGELAQPPRMWSTHPMNHEREQNAKRRYLYAPADERSGWTVFDDAETLRSRMTRDLVGETEDATADAGTTLDRLDVQFGREHLKAQYRGMYLGFSPVRHAATADELFESIAVTRPISVEELYPANIGDDLELLRSLEREHALLCSLRDRVYDAPDGVIRHRGQIIRRSGLPAAIATVAGERTDVRRRLEGTIRQVRSLHLAAAAKVSPGWYAYLRGLVGVLHYADHAEANLRDAHAGLGSAWQAATAHGAINERGVRLILAASNDVYRALWACYRLAPEVQPGAAVLAEIGCTSWPAGLGELGLKAPVRNNINEWLRVVEGWVGHTANALSALRRATLDELLVSEAIVADATRGNAPPEAPADAPVAPASYDTLLTGKERGQQVDTGSFWDRFQAASGFFPGLARTVVAVAIVGSVLAFGWMADRANVVVYNALSRPVVTTIDGYRVELAAHAHDEVSVASGRDANVVTQAADGEPIESFTVPVGHADTQLVYTVAGASPLRRWTAVYGNVSAVPPQDLAPQRWQAVTADFLFTDPPAKIESKTGGGTRTVLSAADDVSPEDYADAAKGNEAMTDLVLAHVRYDMPDSPYLLDWLTLGQPLSGFETAFSARRAHYPIDLVAMRAEQNMATGDTHEIVCARHRALAAASPGDGGMAYLAVRCMPPDAARDAAFEAGYKRWSSSPWFANAAAFAASEHGRYMDAFVRYQAAATHSPALRPSASMEAFRLMRFLDPTAAMRDQAHYAEVSPPVRNALLVESGSYMPPGPERALVLLAQGRLDDAVSAAAGSPLEAHIVRMAAGSQGASASLRRRAAALPASAGIDQTTIWLALAEGADASDQTVGNMLGEIDKGFDTPGAAAKMQQFLALAKQGNAVAAEGMLDGLPIHLRAQAFVAGTYLLGDRTPSLWRNFVRRILFSNERPYLG